MERARSFLARPPFQALVKNHTASAEVFPHKPESLHSNKGLTVRFAVNDSANRSGYLPVTIIHENNAAAGRDKRLPELAKSVHAEVP